MNLNHTTSAEDKLIERLEEGTVTMAQLGDDLTTITELVRRYDKELTDALGKVEERDATIAKLEEDVASYNLSQE